MYDERRNWTLQRILVSPTRGGISWGQLVGVLVSVLAQLVILVFALTFVGSLIEGMSLSSGDDVASSAVLLAVGVAYPAGYIPAGVLKGIGTG